MSILITLLLSHLFIISISALAIPPVSTPTNPIRDIQRATSFDALLTAALTDDKKANDEVKAIAHDLDIKMPKVVKGKNAKVVGGAKAPGATGAAPIGGIQCSVM
jgi:hypothetical protein